MAGMLRADADLDALAYVDFRTGAVLSASTRDEPSRLALEIAAQAASQLCAAPPLAARDSHAGETLVVSDSAVHVFALAKRLPGSVVVGVARPGANVALVLSAVRSLASSLVEPEAR